MLNPVRIFSKAELEKDLSSPHDPDSAGSQEIKDIHQSQPVFYSLLFFCLFTSFCFRLFFLCSLTMQSISHDSQSNYNSTVFTSRPDPIPPDSLPTVWALTANIGDQKWYSSMKQYRGQDLCEPGWRVCPGPGDSHISARPLWDSQSETRPRHSLCHGRTGDQNLIRWFPPWPLERFVKFFPSKTCLRLFSLILRINSHEWHPSTLPHTEISLQMGFHWYFGQYFHSCSPQDEL